MQTRLTVVLALCAILAALALAMIVVVTWPVASGERWSIVGSASTLYYTLVTLGIGATAIVAGSAAFGQIAEERKRARAELGPYLRVDLAPEEVGVTWSPYPADEVDDVLTYETMEPGGQAPSTALDRWPGGRAICLWLTNLQRSPSGVADAICVEMLFELPDPTDETSVVEVDYEVRFAYLAPLQRLKYVIANVSDDIPWLRGRVTSVRYSNLYQEELEEAHGSSQFEVKDGQVFNGRTVWRPKRSGR